MIQPVIENWKQPQVISSLQLYESGDKCWINGRIQNLPIANWFKKRIVGRTNGIQRLAISIAITGKDTIENGRKVLRPVIWDHGIRDIFYNDSPDLSHEYVTLPASFKLVAETKILAILEGKVKAYKANGFDMVDLPEGKYELLMQVSPDGRIIDVHRKFKVVSKPPFIKWIGKQWQEEKL